MPKLSAQNLEQKIDEILKISRENEIKIAKLYRWRKVSQILFWLKVLVVVLIIISAWIYLPPIFEALIKPYQELLANYQQVLGVF
jgi:hypothetical protein